MFGASNKPIINPLKLRKCGTVGYAARFYLPWYWQKELTARVSPPTMGDT